jgi:hypothetical protein
MRCAEAPKTGRHERDLRFDRTRLALLGIVALAALARLHDIDRLGIWVDEANTILSARSLSALFDKLRLDSSPPLFYVVLHFWMRVVGDASWALRLLPALIGVVLVACIAWAGRELISRRAGLWAALFAAVSPIQIFYSKQVRMYSLLPLLALLSVTFLLRTLAGGGRRDRALWIVFTILALYTHNFAVYLLLVHGALIALSGRLVPDFRSWALAGTCVALAYAPWIPVLLEQLGNQDHYAWFLEYWENAGPLAVFLHSFLSYSPEQQTVTVKYQVWRGWPTFAVVALAVFGAWRQAGRHGHAVALWPCVYLLVPMAAALLASSWLTPHYVAARVDQMMFPAFALLVGAGVAGLRPALLRVAVMAAIVAVAIASRLGDELGPVDPFVPGNPEEVLLQGERHLAEHVIDRWRPGDVILCTSLSRAPLEYYLGRARIEARLLSFPRDTAAHLGAQNDARWLGDRRALAREATDVLAEARALMGADGRLIVVRVKSPINGFLRQDPLERRFGYRQVEHLGEFRQVAINGGVIEVAIYERVPEG